MLISTKGRYALRVMTDIAEHGSDAFIPLQEISERQEISRKYLESIMTILSKKKLVISGHGKGGGYKLARSPEEYPLLEILELTEETLAPVACLKKDAEVCPRCGYCRTLPLWTELNDMIRTYLGNKTIADLMRQDSFDDYII